MRGTDPGSAREEAERLVATALAAARLATSGRPAGGGVGQIGDLVRGLLGQAGTASGAGGTQGFGPGGAQESGTGPGDRPGGGFATGSAECCVCPVCRAIAALRDPDPEFVERLATGAGDFAAGVASLLRALSSSAASSTAPDSAPASSAGSTPGSAPPPGPPPASGGETDSTGDRPPARWSSRDDEVWRAASRTGHDSWPGAEPDVWAAATRAEARVPPADAAGADGSGLPKPTGSAGPGGPGSPRPAGTKPMARKAVKPPRTPGDEA